MLIKPGSPLRNVPAGVDGRTAFVIDGLRFAMDAAALSFARLRLALLMFSTREKPLDTDAPALAMSDAWATVDAMNRVVEMVMYTLRTLDPQQTDPWDHLDDVTPRIRDFLRVARSARDLRNGFHHLPSKLNLALSQAQPVMGILRWVHITPETAARGEATFYFYVSGSTHNSTVAMGPDILEGSLVAPIARVTLSAFGAKLDLSSAGEALPALIAEFEEQLLPQFKGQKVRPCGLLGSGKLVGMQFVPVPATATTRGPRGRMGLRNGFRLGRRAAAEADRSPRGPTELVPPQSGDHRDQVGD